MQNIVFPRLSPLDAERLRESILSASTAPAFSFDRLDQSLSSPSSFPPTGGTRLTYDQLLEMRARIQDATEPSISSTPISMTDFDLVVGAELHSWGQQARGEMGVPEVWDFLTLVLAPDLAWMRVVSSESRPSSSSGLRRRLIGGDRRHVFQKLWKRWTVFGPELVKSRQLTEDDYVATLERRLTLERPEVARRIAHTIITSGYHGSARREYTRILMRHLIQMSGIVYIGEDSLDHLDAVMEQLHWETVQAISETQQSG